MVSLPFAWAATVTHLERVDAVSHGDDRARALLAEEKRRRPGVDALTSVDVDEVHPGGRHLDLDLARTGIGHVVLAHLEDVTLTVLSDEDTPRSRHDDTLDAATSTDRVAQRAPSSLAWRPLRVSSTRPLTRERRKPGSGRLWWIVRS